MTNQHFIKELSLLHIKLRFILCFCLKQNLSCPVKHRRIDCRSIPITEVSHFTFRRIKIRISRPVNYGVCFFACFFVIHSCFNLCYQVCKYISYICFCNDIKIRSEVNIPILKNCIARNWREESIPVSACLT